MSIKRRLFAGLLCLALAVVMAVPAGAYHRGKSHGSRCKNAGEPCPYGDCALGGPHEHDGVFYCGRGGAGSPEGYEPPRDTVPRGGHHGHGGGHHGGYC